MEVLCHLQGFLRVDIPRAEKQRDIAPLDVLRAHQLHVLLYLCELNVGGAGVPAEHQLDVIRILHEGPVVILFPRHGDIVLPGVVCQKVLGVDIPEPSERLELLLCDDRGVKQLEYNLFNPLDAHEYVDVNRVARELSSDKRQRETLLELVLVVLAIRAEQAEDALLELDLGASFAKEAERGNAILDLA